MFGIANRRQQIEKRLNTNWIWGAAFGVLFVAMATWRPPTSWLYTSIGIAFLGAAIPAVLVALRYRFMWIEAPLFAVLLLQAWILDKLMSEGAAGVELFLPLYITAGGTYLFMYAMRHRVLQWLDRSGAI